MTYGIELYLSQTPNDQTSGEIVTTARGLFEGANLTATISTASTGDDAMPFKVSVQGSNALPNGDYQAELSRARAASVGLLAATVKHGAVKVSAMWGGPVIASVGGEAVWLQF